jgi:hypothetical protein
MLSRVFFFFFLFNFIEPFFCEPLFVRVACSHLSTNLMILMPTFVDQLATHADQ